MHSLGFHTSGHVNPPGAAIWFYYFQRKKSEKKKSIKPETEFEELYHRELLTE